MENIEDEKSLEASMNDSKPAIVLDLDDTIIKCTTIKTSEYSFSIKLMKNRRIYVQIRPGLPEFLKQISLMFDIFFFTASKQTYANQIINMISPETPLNHRFFRNSCQNMCGYLVKDLSLINKSLNQTLLIDDVQGSSLLQPENFIKISPWDGNKDDTVLIKQLLPILVRIEKEKNFSLAIKQILNSNANEYNDLSIFI